MSISAVSSTTTATTTASTSSSSSTSFSSQDFLSLLVEQLQNQNPLEPTSTDKVLEQMMSYASYGQQSDTNATLESIATKLDSIASALDISV
ncbi:flagellar basal-body rod modification protein FlgD [Devosia sp. YR412]|uniref:flagellar hook capping FlgD N-terminal domain-containing protein n=1 Tax=Devosia sp. YR412 TaxID=1881030 RepID=UPI0008C07D96|nr:flagellar hook capping FlgD N-terminal domain-containing protein [Devosia sp. YR412]SEQ52328.1 flagellar basal-body rod modification protein FlgD [Devosia sp. YR412]